MSLLFRSISVFGRFPFVRLIQVIDNPRYLLHIIKKNLIYKRSKIDYTDKYSAFTFMSGQESLEDLIKNKKSLARFSDGEFEQIVGAGEYPPDSDWCQKWSKPLIDDMLKTLSSEDDRLLVAVDPPSTFLGTRDSTHSIRFEYNMWVDMRRLMWTFLCPGRSYGHSHLFIEANSPDFNWAQFKDHLREKHVIVATGNTDKISDLNLGLKTYFVECGTENAYERKSIIKDNITNLIKNNGLDKNNVLVLLSLGPTAGILAREFIDDDICAWDTGHMFKFAAKKFSA
ncbi:GT-D fold domain-containing glycosyltransferase [Chromobacterium subtsugae]|uniref:GT-D fold domain-containing glycosyltransferase n=1 Tax=Chromobacterium subtsugae TaxID=251747 RepID=UPI00096BFB33|nr:GT-D fold domain-containing glycosyltransferase [Chromobacterium subtsugae]